MIIHKSFGLDLGTTNSTASVYKDGHIVYNEEGKLRNKSIPSIFAFRNNEELVGTKAKTVWNAGFSAKKSIKREMGKNNKFLVGNKEYTPQEISAKIINYCKETLMSTIHPSKNEVYDNVVITVPAYFTLAQKDATREAAELCGLNTQLLLEEPTAAAINYADDNGIENGLFFVFDLGGGTLDVSILEKIGNVPCVLATAGNNFLGGDNFDLILARYFLNKLEDEYNSINDVEVDQNNTKFRLLMLAAENVKKQLASEEKININIADVFKDNSGIDLVIDNFDRATFNSLIKDKIEIDAINECEKALNILKEKHGKTLDDITHIILVGGSTHIPYVQEVLRNKYCHTEKLKDITMYNPDLAVSAGAGKIAYANGVKLEDTDVTVLLNSPFPIDGMIYISGKLVKGDMDEIGCKINDEIIKASIENNEFILNIPEEKYKDFNEYIFYNEGKVVSSVENSDKDIINLINPTPVQNETIAVEIIDVEKGKIEKYPIVESGEALPASHTEIFKINQYSLEEVKLPIWEGPRHIFNLEIKMPSNATVGSIITVSTNIDTKSNITLKVEYEGSLLFGKYEYIVTRKIDEEKVSNLDEQFDKRIKFVEDEALKEELISKKENISRELEEAKSNNDDTHYSTVSEKYEKIVTNLPVARAIKPEEFDELATYIKENRTPEIAATDMDIDNLVFYGKRYIRKGNMEEAQKCYDKLSSIKEAVENLTNPYKFFEICKFGVINGIIIADKTLKDPTVSQSIKTQLSDTLNDCIQPIQKILDAHEKISEDDEYNAYNKDNDDIKQDAFELLNYARNIFDILEQVNTKEAAETVSVFKGLVSKV